MRRESNKPLMFVFSLSDMGKIVLLQIFMGRPIRVDRGLLWESVELDHFEARRVKIIFENN